MGLPKKIALTGGLLIGSIVLIAVLAKKTNILSGVKTGLSNIGSSLGTGLGQGIQNLGTGFWGGLTGIGQQAAGSNWLSSRAGLEDLLKGLNPFADPRVLQAYGEVSPDAAGAGAAAADTTVTPSAREYSDLVGQTVNIKSSSLSNAFLYGGRVPTQIVSAKPISISLNGGKPIQTVDIKTSSGYFSRPNSDTLAERIQDAQKAVKNYVAPKPTANKAPTGGSRPAPSSSNKNTTFKASNGKTYTLTKAKGSKK